MATHFRCQCPGRVGTLNIATNAPSAGGRIGVLDRGVPPGSVGSMTIAWETPSPHCVICGHGGRGEALPFHMTHGIAVWLCVIHRAPRFLRRRRGRIFTERLHAAWLSAGRATKKQLNALDAHMRRMNPTPPKRDQPGSYSWPQLRALAEERFAAGEDPDIVISDLRQRYANHAPASVPSVRTMRRWHTQARWLDASRPPTPSVPAWLRKPGWLRRPLASNWPTIPHDVPLAMNPLGWFIYLWNDDRPDTMYWRRC